MRKPIIAGNWKMYLSPDEGAALVEELAPLVKDAVDVEVLVCPAFPALNIIASAISDTNISLGAQNLYPMKEGAYTGEVSPTMLKAIGCKYCIIGHSERRQYFNEQNTFINEKIKAALDFDLIPIVCVGESLDERESGRARDIIGSQIEAAFNGISGEEAAGMVAAYEPIWAIGTGKTASPEQAEEIHRFIRHKLSLIYGEETAEAIRIQYGGSVKPGNVDELMSQPNIDGALVGGAALNAESFARIVNFEAK